MKRIVVATALMIIYAGLFRAACAQTVTVINQGNMVIVNGTVLSVHGDFKQTGDDLIAIDENAVIDLTGNLYKEGEGTMTDGLTGTAVLHGNLVSTPDSELLVANLQLYLEAAENLLQVNGNLRITDKLIFTQGSVDVSDDSLILAHHEEAGNRLGQFSGEQEGRQFTASKQNGMAIAVDNLLYTATEITAPIEKGNLGLTADMTTGPGGILNVTRYHQYTTTLPNAIVQRVYDVTTTNDPSGGIVTFTYFDHELGGLAGEEDNLELFQSADGGATWEHREAAVDSDANTVTSAAVATINGLWALSTCTYPEATIAADVPACEQSTVTLAATVATPGTFSYQWYAGGDILTNETAAALAVEVGADAMDLMLAITNQYGCVRAVPYTVTPLALPAVDLGDDVTKCSEDLVTLEAAPGFAEYQWADENDNIVSTDALLEADAGIYTLTVRSGDGCVNNDDVAVNNYEAPQAALPAEVRDCGESTVIGAELEVLNDFNFVWFNEAGEAVGNTPTLTVFEEGPYTVEMESPQGCKTVDATSVVLNTDDFADLGEDISVACRSVTLDAGFTGAEYVWSDGSTSRQLTVTASGEYWVEIKHPSGCTDRDTVLVDILPAQDSAFYLAATEAQVQDTVYFIGLTTAATETVRWDFDDGVVADGTLFPDHIYTATGAYDPELTTVFPDGCVDTYAKRITIIEQKEGDDGGRIDTEKDAFKEIVIYPNPNNGRFKLDMELAEAATVQIALFNPGPGQLLHRQVVNGAANYSLDFDYSLLNPGVYHLRIEAMNTIKWYRIVVVR